MQVDVAGLIRSLQSQTCPACGRGKKPRHTFCFACYGKLPYTLKHRLYDPVGSGYEEAVTEALKYLGVETFHHPPEPARSPR